MLLLKFAIGSAAYAVDSAHIEEVVPWVGLRPVPHAPAFLAGVFHYRGKVVPVVDLGLLLAAQPAPNRLSTRIMVVRTNRPGLGLLGLLACQVSDLVRVEADKLKPPAVQVSQARYLGPVAQTPEGLVQILNVDHILPADLVPAEVPAVESGMTGLGIIELLLAERIGLDVASTGPALIHRAVQTRMQICNLTDAEQYAKRVETDEAELRGLIDLVVVTESWFFRDLRPFLRLQEFVRSEWRPRGPACFRVLSIPCARGEEAYSLAIALLDAGLTREQIVVDAIDVSDAVLGQARSGLYRTNAFRKEMIGNPSHYLTEIGSGFEIRPEVRDLVRFRQGNLLDVALETGESEYDAVFCRNVLIYMTPAAKEIAVARLAILIRPGGLLFVGHAEALTILRERFVADADIASFAYRKPLTGADKAVSIGPPKSGSRSADRTRSIRRPPRALLGPSPKKTLPIPNAPNDSPEKPATESLRDAKLAQASQLADRREYAHAARLCKELLAEQGPDARVYFLLGMIELGEGRAVEAETYLHKVAYLDNNNVEALLALASLARQRGDTEAAERHARRARRVEGEKRSKS